MTPAARVPVFLNARAGTGTIDAAALQQKLGDSAEVTPIDPATLRERSAAEAAAGTPLIGVAGGDGSMRTAASALVGSATALLPVPTGTLNHFARRCGITDQAVAATALRDPQIRALPVGDLGSDIFLNTLTIGGYARSVRIRERWRRWLGKWPAAFVGVMTTAVGRRHLALSIETDTETLSRLTPLLWIGIGWGSFPRVHEALERRSSPDLELAVLRPGSRRAGLAFLLRIGWRTLRGQQPVRDNALEVLHTRSLAIAARHRIDVTADGEVLRLPTPLHITVRDHALRVVVAEPSGGEPNDQPARRGGTGRDV